MEYVGGFIHGYEPEEGPDSGNAGIAATGAVLARAFDMSEEVAHQFGVQVVDLEFRWNPAGPFAGEA
jgi:hypothetical protein